MTTACSPDPEVPGPGGGERLADTGPAASQVPSTQSQEGAKKAYPSHRKVLGERTPCAHLPFPGPSAYLHHLHDCWVVYIGRRYGFYMGGRDPDDKSQGVLVAQRNRSSHRETFFETPEATGPVSIFFARWHFACFTTPRGGIGAFDPKSGTFLSTEEASTRCPIQPG